MTAGEGIWGIIRSYNGIAQRSRRAAAGAERPRAGGLRGQAALCVISSMKFIIKRPSIYLLLYISPAYSYILYILFPIPSFSFNSNSELVLLPCFCCSPIYGTPILLFFNPRKKNKKRPLRFYPQEPFRRNCTSLFSQDC